MPDLGDERLASLWRLHALLQERGEDGAYRHSDTEVLDLMALVLIGLLPSMQPRAMSAFERDLLFDFARRIGAGGEQDGAALAQTINSYFEAHPLSAGLLAAVDSSIRAVLRQGASSVAGAEFRRFIADKDNINKVLETGARPEGTTAAGPLARHQLMPAPKGSRKRGKPGR